MNDQVIILIERNTSREFSKFVTLFKNNAEIPIKEAREKVAKSSYYEFILNKIYALNETIQSINPEFEPFILPTLLNIDGKIIHTFKRSCNIEISDKDPNFLYLKIKSK